MIASRRKSSILHRLPSRHYPRFERGSGSRIYDDSGREFIDAAGGGAGVASLGHAHPYVVEQLCEQHRRLSYVYNLKYTNDQAERLADRLRLKAGGAYQVYFAQDGTEANEAALRASLIFHQKMGHDNRNVIISYGHGYYGSTFGAMALSTLPSARRPVAQWLPQFEFVDISSRFSRTEDEFRAPLDAIAARVGSERIAAVVMEPIVVTGVLEPPQDYLKTIAAWCKAIGALLILDEIVTGAGRTGAWLAAQHWEIRPDMFTMGKGLGAGFAALSALHVSDSVYDAIIAEDGVFHHGHSLSANPAACSVGNAVLDVIEADQLESYVNDSGEWLREQIREELQSSGALRDVRGRGHFIGIELGTASGFIPMEQKFAFRFEEACFDQSLLVFANQGHPLNLVGDYVILWPAFNSSREELREIVRRLGHALRQCV